MRREQLLRFVGFCLLLTLGIALIIAGGALLQFLGFGLAAIAQTVLSPSPGARKRDGLIIAVVIAVGLLLLLGLNRTDLVSLFPVSKPG